ncbi:annexin-like protein RJ4, partial [Silene latifolia]|uniref:annexin-like protein RJ4 n=1 Tax=Silene latifolia TaxID=37657 RepID=UPI003D76F1A5
CLDDYIYWLQLVVLLVSVHRFESEVTDRKLAEAEAKILHECIQDNKYNHDEIIRILTTRSKAQLVATFYRFRDVFGTPITKSLTTDKDKDFVSALQTTIRCIKSPHKYLEKVLSDAMHKRGTDEDAITRVIVTRAEKDLGRIKELFYKRNSVTLEHAVAKETHGDYEKFLLTIMGNQGH